MRLIALVLRCVALSSTSKQRIRRPAALVTGASRGIGRSIALRLADMGYNLFLLARNETALKDVAAEVQALGCSADYLAGELTVGGYIGEALAAAVQAFGPVNVLVNNAGGAKQQAVQDADVEAWNQLMDLNFNSIVALCRGTTLYDRGAARYGDQYILHQRQKYQCGQRYLLCNQTCAEWLYRMYVRGCARLWNQDIHNLSLIHI